MELSESPSKYGLINTKRIKIIVITTNPTISLNVNYGWNGILSVFHVEIKYELLLLQEQ